MELILQARLELWLPEGIRKGAGAAESTVRLKSTDIFKFHVIILSLSKGEERKVTSFKA